MTFFVLVNVVFIKNKEMYKIAQSAHNVNER